MNSYNFSDMSLKDIQDFVKKLYHNLEIKDKIILEEELAQDTRKNVQSYAKRLEKNRVKHEKEIERVQGMWQIENKLYEKYNLIAGTDEVGRGPIAGPVVACAVVLPKDVIIEGINDSKKISEKKREELSQEIKEKALALEIVEIDADYIDKINILKASQLAMAKAVANLGLPVDHIVIDGNQNIPIDIPQTTIIGGDSRSISIAAASIVAKVYRDHLMVQFSETYPGYGFEKHKGYGTREHYESIQKLGPCPIHRRSFNLKV